MKLEQRESATGPPPQKGVWGSPYLVMRSNMDRGSRIKVGSTTRLKSAPGRSWEIICDRTDRVSMSTDLNSVVDQNSHGHPLPFPWSGSTSSSSPLVFSTLSLEGSSSDERVPVMLKKEPQSADMVSERRGGAGCFRGGRYGGKIWRGEGREGKKDNRVRYSSVLSNKMRGGEAKKPKRVKGNGLGELVDEGLIDY